MTCPSRLLTTTAQLSAPWSPPPDLFRLTPTPTPCPPSGGRLQTRRSTSSTSVCQKFQYTQRVEGWRALADNGIEVHEIPGSHLDIVKEPHVGELAKKLGSCLERAQAQLANNG